MTDDNRMPDRLRRIGDDLMWAAYVKMPRRMEDAFADACAYGRGVMNTADVLHEVQNMSRSEMTPERLREWAASESPGRAREQLYTLADAWDCDRQHIDTLQQNWQRCVEHAARVEEERNRLREAAEIAYGHLWHMAVDKTTLDGQHKSEARRALLGVLAGDQRRRGVHAANEALGEFYRCDPVSDTEKDDD